MSSLKMPKVDRQILKNKDKIVNDIADFTKRDNILSENEELKPYETDGLAAYKQTPMLVVLPENTNEVSKILSYCNKNKIKVVPRGAGTGLAGSALPLADCILLGLGKFNKIKDIDWIRIHYAHPAHLSDKIIKSMANAEKVCNYLDMPVQHASDNMLKKMRRGLGNKGIVKKIKSLRQYIPNIALRTTLIVGHPGETIYDFKLLKQFVEEIQFDRLGVFTYSEEDGTLAAKYKDDVPREIKDKRKNMLLDIQNDISFEKNQSYVGKKLKVIVDKMGDKISVGRSEFDSPEIDNIVHIKSSVKVGSFVKVKIESANEYELIGRLI